MSSHWQRVRDLFEAGLEVDPRELTPWLEAQAADPAVRAEVQSLLEHHSRAGSFLDKPVGERIPDLMGALDDEGQALEPGAVLGNYTIERELGRGAMGRVYLATDARLGRTVALKSLAPHLIDDQSHRERLRREAQAAAALTHPGICTVYALEEFDGQLFIATEVVDGQTLREEISPDRQPGADLILSTARELAEALASAHAKGITHRDLKPENIMRDSTGRLKILDFGLARMPSPESKPYAVMATLPGVLVGTPAYMAPEQLNGQPADARADVFAFGVVMYEYACGVHPFESSSSLGLVARVLESDAQPLADRCRHIPPAVEAVIDRSLRKRPADRFASAAEIVAALQSAEASAPGRATASRRTIWWRGHQLTMMAVYVLATTVAWGIKQYFPGPLSLWLFVAFGIGAAVAGVSRGHLVFTEIMNTSALPAERRRLRPLLTSVDMLLAFGLAIDGLWIASGRPLYGMLTIALGVGIGLAAMLMEPATTSAAFPE